MSDCDSLTHRSGVKLDWHVGFEGQSIFVGFDNASLGVPFTVLGVAEAADVLEMASDQIKIFYVVVVQDVFEPEVDDRGISLFLLVCSAQDSKSQGHQPCPAHASTQ